jgi:hypothetical protein
VFVAKTGYHLEGSEGPEGEVEQPVDGES